MGAIYNVQNPYKWLGAQATAQGVVPVSAGVPCYSATSRSRLGLKLHSWELQNRNASALNLALVGLLGDEVCTFGTMASAGTAVTDATAAAQSGTSNAVALEAKADAGAGFVVGANIPWGCLGLNVSTAGVGASQTHTYKYWNGASLVTLTPVLIAGPTTAGQVWAAGENVVLFDPPSDWVVGGPVASWPPNQYNLEVVMAVVGTTDALARRVYVGAVFASANAIVATPGFYNPYLADVIHMPAQMVALGSAWSLITVPNSVRFVYNFGG